MTWLDFIKENKYISMAETPTYPSLSTVLNNVSCIWLEIFSGWNKEICILGFYLYFPDEIARIHKCEFFNATVNVWLRAQSTFNSCFKK